MSADTYLLDIAVREVMRRHPALARAMRRKVEFPLHTVFGWDTAEIRIKARYAALATAEWDFWASKTVASAEDAGRRLELLGHPGFLIGSAA